MRHVIDYIKRYPLLLAVIIPAFIFHMLIIMPSGSHYCFEDKCGLFFWGAHGHDAIWHLAVSSVSFNSFPFVAPTFSGALLTGYNFLLDFVIFLLSKIGIPQIFSYFKLLPLLWFALFTYAAITFARKLHNSPIFTVILLIFFYFAGSFGYIFTLYHSGTLWGSEGILAMQSGHSLINPQYAFSLVFLLLVLNILSKFTLTVKNTLVLGVLLFVIVGLKFYGGAVTAFIIFSFYTLYGLKNRKLMKTFAHIVGMSIFLILSIMLFYNPFYSLQSGSTFVFAPFAITHAMIESPNLFYLRDMVNARYFLQENGGWGPRLLSIELMTAFLFFFFNLGVRFFGLLYYGVRSIQRKVTLFEVVVMLGILFATTLSLLLIQKGEWWNTIQFFYYAIFLSNIFIAQFIYTLLKKRGVFIIVAIILMLSSLPINIDLLRNFTGFPATAYVSDAEREALTLLSRQPEGVVLTPLHESGRKTSSPNPLSTYDDTAYVSAFSGKQTYFSNATQLKLLGINFTGRKDQIKKSDCGVLQDVSYLYDVDSRSYSDFKDCNTHLQQVYRKENFAVYSIIKEE